MYQQHQHQQPAHSRSNSNPTRNAAPGTYVTELRPCDVLFGRGSGPNDHEGNVRFRQFVAARKSEYMATNHRQTKTNIAREIVNLVEGNFLKKVEASEAGFPAGTDVYEVVDDDTVMEKAKQALRQNATKTRSDPLFGVNAGDATAADIIASANRTNFLDRPTVATPHHAVFQQEDLEPIPLQSSDLAAAAAAYPRQNEYAPSAIPAPIRSSSDFVYQHQSHGNNTTQSLPVDYSYPNRGGGSNNNNNNEIFVQSTMPPPQPRPPTATHHQQQQQQQHVAYQLSQQQRQQTRHPTATAGNSAWDQSAMQAPVSGASSDSIDIYEEDDIVANSPLPVMYGTSPNRNSLAASAIRSNAALYAQPPQHSDLANYSMAEIPGDDDDVFHERNKASRRRSSDYAKFNSKDGNSSMRVSQLFRGMGSGVGGGGSSVMDELMDSFTQMRTGDEAALNRRFMASTDTMGTIEPLGSVADMSLGTMNSSTFSLFRGNESVTLSDESSQHLSLLGSTGNHASSSTATRSSKYSNESSTSLNITDMYDFSRSKKFDSMNSSSLNGMITDIRKQVDSEFSQPPHHHHYQLQSHMFKPRSSIGTVEETSSDEMGDSTQDVFKSVLSGFKQEDEPDEDILPPRDHFAKRTSASPEIKKSTSDK